MIFSSATSFDISLKKNRSTHKELKLKAKNSSETNINSSPNSNIQKNILRNITKEFNIFEGSSKNITHNPVIFEKQNEEINIESENEKVEKRGKYIKKEESNE